MGKIKLNATDTVFSQCIRERAGWTCERCGKQYTPPTQALHCSHFHSRGKWGTRFDPDNAEALCYGCHSHMGGNPVLHTERIREKLGPHLFDALRERAQSTELGRMAKRQEKEIRKHYRRQLEAVRQGGELVGYF